MTSLHERTAQLREAVVPGWLAEAMPDWLTEAVRPKPAPVPWERWFALCLLSACRCRSASWSAAASSGSCWR
jgi:hypothetical protein